MSFQRQPPELQKDDVEQQLTSDEARRQRYEQEEQAAIQKQLNRWQRRAAFRRPAETAKTTTIPAWLNEDAQNCKRAWKARRDVVGSIPHVAAEERLTPDSVLEAARAAAAGARAVVDNVRAAPPACDKAISQQKSPQPAAGSSSSACGLLTLSGLLTLFGVLGLVLALGGSLHRGSAAGFDGSPMSYGAVLLVLLCHFIFRFVCFVERGGSATTRVERPAEALSASSWITPPGKPSARPGRAVRVSRELEVIV